MPPKPQGKSGNKPQQQQQQQKKGGGGGGNNNNNNNNNSKKKTETSKSTLTKVANNNVCPVENCQSQIDFILPECDYCDTKHCAQHRIPERHGCGDAAAYAKVREAEREAREIQQKKKEASRAEYKALFEAKKKEMAAKKKH